MPFDEASEQAVVEPPAETASEASQTHGMARATSILALASLATMTAGIAANKIVAVKLGPAGVGLQGLYTGYLAALGIAFSLGLSGSMVKLLPKAIVAKDLGGVAKLVLGGRATALASGIVAICVSLVAGRWLAEFFFGTGASRFVPAVLAISYALSLQSIVQTSIINAHHRVKELAKLNASTGVATPVATAVCVVLWGTPGILAGLVIAQTCALTFSTLMMRAVMPAMPRPALAVSSLIGSARDVLHTGLSFALGGALGAGVQALLPFMVLNMLGSLAVGYYKAAVLISVAYLAILGTAMGQDYFPRLAAVRGDNAKIVSMANDQHGFVLAFCTPVIILSITLAPFIVPLLYTNKFGPTIDMLEWQMLGDLFKMSTWALGYIVIACLDSRTYIMTESTAAVLFIMTNYVSFRVWGINGLGVGFFASYVLYSMVIYGVVHRQVRFRFRRENLVYLVIALSTVTLVRVASLYGMTLRLSVGLPLALIFGVHAFRKYIGWSRLRGLLSRFLGGGS